MTAAEEIRRHRARCRPYMLELQMRARGEAGLPPVPAEIGRATGAILAEVRAATCAALAVTGPSYRHPGARTFLQVRLNRLTAAADEAVAAARDGNPVALRRLLDRFEALISAIWTVQDAVCGTATTARPTYRNRLAPS
jgi:hypothetical protein